MQSEIEQLEEAAEVAKSELAESQDRLNEANAAAEKVKKTSSKASKAYERAIKEIASFNDQIEKLASERLAIYKRCKLEEIDLPLKKGNLDAVPLEEVGHNEFCLLCSRRVFMMLTLPLRTCVTQSP